MSTPLYKIDLAEINDADVIAKIYVDSWNQAYAQLILSKFLTNMKLKDWKTKFIKSIESRKIYICRSFLNVLGFLEVIEGRELDIDNSLEIRCIYIDPLEQNKGAGSQLIKYILNYARDNRFKAVFLWSFTENYKANQFYKKQGFHLDNKRQTINFDTCAVEIQRWIITINSTN